MNATATLTWFARHELTLAWRDWAAMMAGGRTKRERAVTIGALFFIGLLHWLAYAILAPILKPEMLASKQALIVLTATLLLTFSMMMSQAIEQVTRAFYARSDLDLILSSPASSQHLFAIRIGSIAVAGAMMTSLLTAPFINMATYLNGAHFLSAYAVIAAMSMLATGLAVIGAIALFKSVGPKRTRLIAQIVAAVVGAALLIGLQVAAIMLYGNLSRFDVLKSDLIARSAPDASSLFWLPANAVLGDALSIVALMIAGGAFLATVIAHYSNQFGGHAIAAAGVSDHTDAKGSAQRPFRSLTAKQALRAKEWTLLKRDPWLASQTLMQILYLVPPALLLWRDMGANTQVHVILAPVLVMAFGQLAGGLAWLAISGEDAPDLVATAPLPRRAIMRAKNEAVLMAIATVALPLVGGVAIVSIGGAIATAAGIAVAAVSAIAIQLWFRVTATRSQFRRRQTASKTSTFAEAFSSIFWAGATGFAAAGSLFALPFVALALITLAIAYAISPRA
ncbi:MAG: permease [Hyphomicrobium sp.]|nr:permease [Hyphomicrobium sp.]